MHSTPRQPRRKRNLLRTFGSRHRLSGIAVSVSATLQGMSRFLCQEIDWRITCLDSPADISSKSPMARCVTGRDTLDTPLVEDSSSIYSVMSPVTPAEEGNQSLDKRCNNFNRKLLSPFQMHPVSIRPAESPVTPTRSSLEIRKTNRATPTSRRHTASSLQIDITPDLVKSWELSMTSLENTTLLDEKMQSLFRVKSSVPAEQDKLRRKPLQRGHSAVQAKAPDPEEINDKVWAMLKATDNLKPGTMPPVAHSSSKVARPGHSKMLSKVSEAWSRFYVKSVSPERKERRDLGLNMADPDDPREGIPDASRRSPSPVSSIEIRLNETMNLDKVKVQRVVGGCIPRKPVPPRESSSRNRCEGMKSLSAVSSSVYSQPSADGVSTVQETIFNTPPHVSPFDSERDFEDNLPDGVLDTSPAGSSTPRAHARKVSDTTASATSVGSSGESSTAQLDMARIVATPGKVDYAGKRARQITLVPSRSQRRPGQAPPPRMATELRTYVREDDVERVKKHPSPSKPLLNTYALALQQCPGVGISLEEVDELAVDHLSLAHPLTERDPNRPVRRRKFGQSACQSLTPSAVPSQLQKYDAGAGTVQTNMRGSQPLLTDIRPSYYSDIDELL